MWPADAFSIIFFKRNAPKLAVLNCVAACLQHIGAGEKTDAHVFFLFLTDPLLICSIVFLLSFFDVINLADRIPLKRPLHGALQGWRGDGLESKVINQVGGLYTHYKDFLSLFLSLKVGMTDSRPSPI